MNIKLEKICARDVPKILPFFTDDKYTNNVNSLLVDIGKEGFCYKAVDEDGNILAGIISYQLDENSGYISEAFTNGKYAGRKGFYYIAKEFDIATKGIDYFFEVYKGSYWNANKYITYYKSHYVDMKLYIGNRDG